MIGALFGIGFVFLALFVSLWISFSDLGFYRDFREEMNDYHYIGKDAEELEVITKDLIRFVQIGGEERITRHFNEREVAHMRDVRILFIISEWIMGISAIVCIMTLIHVVQKKKTGGFIAGALWAIVLMLLVFGLFGVWMVFSFDTAFLRFHEIFFNNDLWILDPKTDMMIRMLPQELFTRLFVRTLVGFAMSTGLFTLLLLILRRTNGYPSNDRSHASETGSNRRTNRITM